jgi:chemotaxis signal transduction protein
VLDIEIDKRKIQLGLVVDEVSDVQKINVIDINPVPAGENKFDAEFIEGAFKKDEHYIYILNAYKIFAIKEIQLKI